MVTIMGKTIVEVPYSSYGYAMAFFLAVDPQVIQTLSVRADLEVRRVTRTMIMHPDYFTK